MGPLFVRSRRPARSGRSIARRKGLWAVKFIDQATLAAAANSSIDLLASAEAAGVGIFGGTVVRTHIALGVSSLDTDTHPELLLGTIVWDKTTILGNSPDVSADFLVDWLSYFYLSPGNALNALARPENAPTSSVWGQNYDIKSRRRLREQNDSYFLQLHNLGSQTITFTYVVRTLVLLP
jgi:hypothetical protein